MDQGKYTLSNTWKILDEENGGFVFYPKSKGQTWSFQASKMAKFLDEYFDRIFA